MIQTQEDTFERIEHKICPGQIYVFERSATLHLYCMICCSTGTCLNIHYNYTKQRYELVVITNVNLGSTTAYLRARDAQNIFVYVP